MVDTVSWKHGIEFTDSGLTTEDGELCIDSVIHHVRLSFSSCLGGVSAIRRSNDGFHFKPATNPDSYKLEIFFIRNTGGISGT